MKTRIIEFPAQELPDGMILKAFHIVNGAGARIGKVSGDLRTESVTQIQARAAETALGHPRNPIYSYEDR